MSVSSFSQQTNPSSVLAKQHYLQKSKNQKTIGLVLLAGGSALITSGCIMAIFAAKDGLGTLGYMLIMGGSGCALAIGSVPFLNGSAKNKKKAMSLSFKNETAPQIQKGSFVYRSVPSITIKLKL